LGGREEKQGGSNSGLERKKVFGKGWGFSCRKNESNRPYHPRGGGVWDFFVSVGPKGEKDCTGTGLECRGRGRLAKEKNLYKLGGKSDAELPNGSNLRVILAGLPPTVTDRWGKNPGVCLGRSKKNNNGLFKADTLQHGGPAGTENGKGPMGGGSQSNPTFGVSWEK